MKKETEMLLISLGYPTISDAQGYHILVGKKTLTKIQRIAKYSKRRRRKK